MKKLFLSIITAAMTGVLCIGFAACSSSVNAKSVKGEEVTEDQWVAALGTLLDDKSTFTVEYFVKGSADYKHKTMVQTTEWGAKMTQRMTYTKNGTLQSAIGYKKMSLSGDKAAAEQSMGKAAKTEVELYSATTASKIYNYEKGRDDKWTRREAYNSVIYGAFGYTIDYLKNSYSAFVYSTEHKGYISKYYDDDDSSITVYKFSGGKLVAIYTYQEDVDIDDEVQEYEIISYKTETNATITYSAKDVILPTEWSAYSN